MEGFHKKQPFLPKNRQNVWTIQQIALHLQHKNQFNSIKQ